jgi:hypothetical protein
MTITKTETATKTATATKTETTLQKKLAASVALAVAIRTSTKPKTQIAISTKPALRVTGKAQTLVPVKAPARTSYPSVPDTPYSDESKPPKPGEPKPPKPGKGKVVPPSAEIESVEGVPRNPGEVLWDQGIVWVEAAPPSPDDIQKGKRGQVRLMRVAPEDARIKDGTPERTLFKRGKAPKKMVVRIGATRATVIKGQKISFSRFTGGGSIMQRGRRGVITSKERSVMKGRRRV